jgi:isopenicillin-N N-acyltransferase-like protein
MEGIAKGSGLSKREILLLNCRTDLVAMGGRKGEVASIRGDGGCTSVALTGRTEQGPSLALGQTWDWPGDSATVMLRLEPDNQPALVAFTEAGMVAKIGFNEHRLGVCLNWLQHRTNDPEGPFGVPVLCLMRAAMTCASLEDAYKLVAWLPRSASQNVLLAQDGETGPRVVDMELTPTAMARIPLNKEGYLVHTNQFKDPALNQGDERGCSRNAAAVRMAEDLRGPIADPAARMKKILESPEVSVRITRAAIVMDLTRNRIHVAAGEPRKVGWVTLPGV